MRKGLILLLFAAICFACGPSEGTSNQREDAVICDVVEWARDAKPEEVESVTHIFGNATVFFAPFCTEYSTNAEDIASFFSFLQTHIHQPQKKKPRSRAYPRITTP